MESYVRHFPCGSSAEYVLELPPVDLDDFFVQQLPRAKRDLHMASGTLHSVPGPCTTDIDARGSPGATCIDINLPSLAVQSSVGNLFDISSPTLEVQFSGGDLSRQSFADNAETSDLEGIRYSPACVGTSGRRRKRRSWVRQSCQGHHVFAAGLHSCIADPKAEARLAARRRKAPHARLAADCDVSRLTAREVRGQCMGHCYNREFPTCCVKCLARIE